MNCEGGCRPVDEAAYWFHLPIGNVVPLCIRCCAIWRRLAAEDPDDGLLQPTFIEVIR